MTRFRYWLADLISGGELSEAVKAAERESRFHIFWSNEQSRLRDHLLHIHNATRDGKSGTAQKINRMAREALE